MIVLTGPTGEAGQFRWTMARGQTGARQLQIDWPDGRGLVLSRRDSPPSIAESPP